MLLIRFSAAILQSPRTHVKSGHKVVYFYSMKG